MSTSQLGQDLNVLKFYKHKKEGFFVEIGASDGVNLSNTYILEKTYRWKGICVEPIPYNFEKLIKNRPHSICSNNAVYNTSGEVVQFDIANSADLLSGISSHIDCHMATVNANKTTINVETTTLTDLLDKYSAPNHIDYLSIDTEGSEYEILRVFNFSKYTFGLVDVEHNYVEPRRSHIRELLTANGYIYLGENKWDDMYKHSSV
jgi:FkbM family methyltransferase